MNRQARYNLEVQGLQILIALAVAAILLLSFDLILVTPHAQTSPPSPVYYALRTRPHQDTAPEMDGLRAILSPQSTDQDPWATLYVVITAEGFAPEVITMRVGSRVVWTNATTESVHLIGDFGNRIYLPLVLRGTETTRMAGSDEVEETPSYLNTSIVIPPGGSYAQDFFIPGFYPYEIQENPGRPGQAVVEPHDVDDPGLAWATGPDGVLLRWRWPKLDEQSGRPLPQPTGYNVYRDDQLLTPTPIRRVTDPATAQALLGSHWDWIQETYNVTTIAEFHAFLDQNALAERWLADQRYPVALVRGLGYLDEAVLPGDPDSHTYQVEAVFPGYTEDVGALTLQNNGVTPLDVPTGLRTTSVISEGLRTSPDWVEAQRNRQGHARVHLVWDLPSPTGEERPPEQWTTSYDVYRAGPVRTGQDPATMVYQLLTADDPVVPMEDHDPVSPITDSIDTYATLVYPRYDSFYADRDLTPCETYAYRVAARDLMGQPAATSAYVTAVVPDTMPPHPPHMLTPTVDYNAGTILLTWEPVTDAVQYTLYRSEVLTAGWPGLSACASPGSCWMTVTQGTMTTYQDTPGYELQYWYVARATDQACDGASPNVSAPSNAVSAILHDRTPPSPPTVWSEDEIIYIEPDPDTSHLLLYCTFDDGSDTVPQNPLLVETFPVTRSTNVIQTNLAEYLTPATRAEVQCSVQAVDGHGNRSTSLTPVTPFDLCPAEAFTLTHPVITGIKTQAVETGGWAANVTWEMETDHPGLVGFEVRRYQADTSTPVSVGGMLIPEARSVLDPDVLPGLTYTYTVSALRELGCDEAFQYPEVTSAPRLYRVVPPQAGAPDALNPCSRPTNDIIWRGTLITFTPGVGAYLAWEYPFQDMLDQGYLRTIVYRSLNYDGGYIAITPPFDTLSYDYLDNDAQHGDYWYVVTVLDWSTGEILAKTPPWSPAYGFEAPLVATVLAPTRAPVPGQLRFPPETETATAPTAPRAATTVDTIDATADTYVTDSPPNVNHGSELHLDVMLDTDGGNAWALVGFDLSALPAGAIINGASFHAYLENTLYGPAQVELYRITEAWGEMTTVWEDSPLVSGPYVTASVGSTAGWVAWEVTPMIQEWWDGTYPNYGIAMLMATSGSISAFTSREGDAAPYLTIDYTPLPETLTFGTSDDNLFVVTGVTYDPDSTPTCMTGSGTIALGGGDLGTTYNRSVSFSCITAEIESGVVISGTAQVSIPSPITVDYPAGFTYAVKSLTLDPDTGYGDVDLELPAGLFFYAGATAYDPIPLTPAIVRQNLTFQAQRSWGGSCGDSLPSYSFEMEPLPLRVVPTGNVLFFHNHVNLGTACTQYEERYNGTRPAFPNVDANDGYLRPVYTSTESVIIDAQGLNAVLLTEGPISYTTAMPYGFEIAASGPISVEIYRSHIDHGQMHDVDVRLDYYREPVTHTIVVTHVNLPAPTGVFSGSASALYFGADGALFGIVDDHAYPQDGIRWAGDDGFLLHEPAYLLYLQPVQTAADHFPWEEAAADALGSITVQAGLNQIVAAPDSVDFTWFHCENNTPITFPEGVSTDLYLRRGGVSDFVTATISAGSPVAVPLYGYDTEIKTFRLSFCDNVIHDSDVTADVILPIPTDEVVPLEDVVINPQTACIEEAQVAEETLTLAFWEIDLHPRAAVFRPRDWQPGDPDGWTRAMWLLGRMDMPHVAPPGSTDSVAPIPIETAFRPDGQIEENRLVYTKVNYGFDGFPLLMSGIELSNYSLEPETPNWDSSATLVSPPTVENHGFVTITGNLVEPIFGTLEGASTGEPPALFVLGWDPYVGFSDQPAAKHTWDLPVTDISWGFDLVYAQHWNTEKPRGTFVSFRSDDLIVVEADQALVLSSWTGEGVTADLLLGLSAGNGVLRALAETTVPSLPYTLDSSLTTTMTEWAGTFGIDSAYVSFLDEIWSQYEDDNSTYAETTYVIDAWADQFLDENAAGGIPSDPPGGGTTPVLSHLLEKSIGWDVQLKKLRGHVHWAVDDTTGDYHFEECRFSLWFKVKREQDREPLVQGERLSFFITRDGDFVLEGNDVKTKIEEYPEVKADFIVVIRTGIPSVEAELAIQDFETGGVTIDEVAATLGVGERIFYLGALVDNARPTYSDEIFLGGAFLFGVLDPSSSVLTETGFVSILEDVGATGNVDSAGRLAGGYLRVYGEMPIYGDSCMFRLSAGGELAIWYFAAMDYPTQECNQYGGRLRGYIHGNLLCVVSARGDLTLELYRNPLDAGTGCGETSLRGHFWAAGGVGFCDPKSWTSWESRWWGDSWCWTAGAVIDANYDGNEENWIWDYDADYE